MPDLPFTLESITYTAVALAEHDRLVRENAVAGLVAAITALADELDTRPGLQFLSGPEVAAGVVQRARALLTADHTAALDKVRADHGERIAQAIEADRDTRDLSRPVKDWLTNAARIARNPGEPT